MPFARTASGPRVSNTVASPAAAPAAAPMPAPIPAWPPSSYAWLGDGLTRAGQHTSVSRPLIATVFAAGLLAWLASDAVTGLAAMLTMLITLVVSALGHWPLESRMNLPSLALLHLGPPILAWRLLVLMATVDGGSKDGPRTCSVGSPW